MKDGPDIARIASLIGDPARANMLSALMDGRALTASELASEAGVSKQTASVHLAKLIEASLLAREVQGRHHYFRLHDIDVAQALEVLMAVAEKRIGKRTRTGPADPALRKARVCYDHLAGEMGVLLFDRMMEKTWLAGDGEGVALTAAGIDAIERFGIEPGTLAGNRRPVCRTCLDWSMRRHHLAGGLGKALLAEFVGRGWARRLPNSRVIGFSRDGENAFRNWLS